MFEPLPPMMPQEEFVSSGWAWAYELLEGASSAGAVACLQMMDPTMMGRDEVVYLTAAAERARRMLDALVLRFQAAAAGPQPGPRDVDEAAEELACALRANPQHAAAEVAAARAIVGRLPLTLKHLEAGEISLRQAKQVEMATRDLDPATAALVEADAVPGDPRRLKMRLVRARGRHAPEAEEKKAEQNRSERRADFWSDPVEGIAGIAVQGPLAQLAQIKAAIDAEARSRVAGECRPLPACRFDVLLGWARQSLGLDEPTSTAASEAATGASVNAAQPVRTEGSDPETPEPAASRRCGSCGRSGPARIPVNVTLSLATLLGLSDAPGELDGMPIPATVARELAADGALRRWLTEPTSGNLLDIGATTYRPNATLDRYIRGRDKTCRFPGCERPSVRCDLDHTLAFHTENGQTVSGNLVALCRRHHRLKHETDWTYRVEPDGTVIWTAPSGHRYRVPPEDHGDDPLLSHELARLNARDRAKHDRRTKPAGPTATPSPPADEQPPF